MTRPVTWCRSEPKESVTVQITVTCLCRECETFRRHLRNGLAGCSRKHGAQLKNGLLRHFHRQRAFQLACWPVPSRTSS